jgi:hypothetical protein
LVRRVGGYALIVLGLVLVFLAPLLRFYVAPRVEKAPTDVYMDVTSTGAGRYFSPKLLQVTNSTPIRVTQIYKGNPAASTKTVSVINAFTRIYDPNAPGADLSYDVQTFAMDRKSGYGVDCCGDNPRHKGVTLKFPFFAKKITYPLWDSTAKKAFPARFVREDTLNGLKVYVYESHVPDTMLDALGFPGSLAGQPDQPTVQVDVHYDDDTTVWIEPVTGAVIKGAQRAVQYATFGGNFVTTLADLNVAYSPAEVKYNVDSTGPKAKQLVLLTSGVPVIGPVIGIILLLVGLFLLRPTSPKRGTPAAEREPVAAVG